MFWKVFEMVNWIISKNCKKFWNFGCPKGAEKNELIFPADLPFSKFGIRNLEISYFEKPKGIPPTSFRVKATNDRRYVGANFTHDRMNENELIYD